MELTILETNSNEGNLLYKLIARGRQADVPFYFSVEEYDVNTGRVLFVRLDCAPAPAFRIAVAGNKIIFVEEDCEFSGLKSWLRDWKIKYKELKKKKFTGSSEAKAYVNKLREKELSVEARRAVIAGLKVKVEKLHREEGE